MNIYKIVHSLPRFFKRHKLVRLLLTLSPKSRVQQVTFNGSARLFADVADPFARSYFLAKGFDPEFFSIAKPFLSRGGVFFDVGANFGFCSFGLISSLAQNGVEYHLFEANADVCDLLSRSAELHPSQSIHVNHCCVTDVPGMSRLNLKYDNFGASFISEGGTQEVRNLVLDSYIYGHSIGKVNLMKIDIEGWEVRALRGAAQSLKSGIVKTVYSEVSAKALSRAGFSVEDYFALLKNNGFRLLYVRAADFESGIAERDKTFTLYVHGYPLAVAEIDEFPAGHLTDILAIHESCEF